MSKISEYQAALKKLADEKEKQTVIEFAKELKKLPDTLLVQLREAGVNKISETDTLSSSDKYKLLKWMSNQNKTRTARKKIAITVDPEERRLARAVAAGANGAEFEVLEWLMSAVLWGKKIPPPLQEVANIIVAKSILIGALPLRKLGRPKLEGLDETGLSAARDYFELVDSGTKYEEAVLAVANKICKSERHVMRLVAKHKKEIGETVELRAEKRAQAEKSRMIWLADSEKAFANYRRLFEPEIPVPELTLDDCLEHLDELADIVAAKAKPLTKKI